MHPIISKENSIVKSLNKNIEHYLSGSEFSSIFPSRSQPGNVYGLANVHKEGTPLRPVVTMLGTAEYHPAKYLVSIINDNMPNMYMLGSNVSFICRLNQFRYIPSHVLVSNVVKSLFTNTSVEETIENVCKHVYQQNDPPKYHSDIFRQLLQIETGRYMLNNGKLYCQIDGVTMGIPLGPTLANFFLALLENLFMNNNFDFFTCSLLYVCR